VKSNRSGRKSVQSQIGMSLAALVVVCLVFSPVSGRAQTYTPNDIYTVVGGGATPSAPLTATLPGASAAVEDASGNIYIAAPDTSYVFKLSAAGTFGNFAGLGYGGHSADGNQASKSLIYAVTGLAVDSKGDVFFADAAGSRIRKVSPTGVISTVAGIGDKCDHAGVCGDGGLAVDADLNLPDTVALDAAGNLYIADAGDNRIRVVNTSKSTITIAGVSIGAGDIQTVAGNSTACASPQSACGDGGMANAANLTAPYGVALDHAGNLYIADTKDHKIRFVNTSSGIISTFAGNGIGCSNQRSGCGDGKVPTSAEVTLPQGVFVDASGNVYIADTGDSRIREVSVSTGLIGTVVDSTGTAGFAGDGGAAASAQLDLPTTVWVDSTGNLFVSDSGNERIRVVNNQTSSITVGGTTIQAGDIATIAGGGSGGDGGAATSATVALPWAVAEDAAGNLYVVDQGNNRIRKVTNPTTTAIITTFAGNGSTGSCTPQTPPAAPICTGDGGPATAASLNAPTSIAFDQSGNLYIADSDNLVIREVNAATGTISTVVGSGLSCYPTTATCGDGGVATAGSFALPLNIAFDSAGNLYITDWQGYKVRKVVPSGGSIANGTISTIAGTGISGSKGNNMAATKANLNHPAGLAVDSAGNVYIADQYNNEVRQIVQTPNASTCAATAGIICQWALNLAAKLSGDGLTKLQGSMWNPLDMAIDPANNVYISGGNNNVVQRISAVTSIFSTVAGTSTNSIQGGFAGDKGPASSAKMANLGAFVDGSENLFIADGGNNRVRYVPLAAAATMTPSALSLGQWALGVTGGAQVTTLNSTGGADLSLTGLTITGTNSVDFSQTNTCGTLPATISPQVACTVSVSLTPSVYGMETAVLNVADNATGSPQLVTLKGSGPNFGIAASPTTLTVVHGSAGTSTITLTPQAKFAQTVAVSCTGAPANSTCTLSPPNVQLFGGAGQSTTLTIQTTATTAPGTYTLTVTGVYAPLSNPTTIALTVQ
jgi:sugar lactone lactonase YvrE